MEAPGPASVLRGHEGDVQCVEFINPTVLAAGDSVGNIMLWCLEQLRPTRTSRLHDPLAGVLSLQHIACPDGKAMLISAGRDGCMKVWQLGEAGELSSSPLLEVRSGQHSFCRPHATARWGGGDKQGTAPQGHGPALESVPCSSREAARAAGCVAGEGGVGACSSVSEREAGGAAAGAGAAPGPGGAAAGAGAAPGPGAAAAGAGAAPGPGGAAAGAGVAPGPGSALESSWRLACAGTNAGEVCLWDLREGVVSGCSVLRSSSAAGKLGMCMAVRLREEGSCEASGPQVISGFEDGSVAVWDLRSPGDPLGVVHAHTEPVLCLALAPGGRELVSGAADAQLCCWSLGPGGQEAEGQEGCRASSSGQRTQDQDSGHGDGAGGAAGLQMLETVALPQAGVSDVAFRPDGRLFASAGWDGKVRLFSSRKKKAVAVLRYHLKEVTCVRFGGQLDGRDVFASASRDKTVALWSVYAAQGNT